MMKSISMKKTNDEGNEMKIAGKMKDLTVVQVHFDELNSEAEGMEGKQFEENNDAESWETTTITKDAEIGGATTTRFKDAETWGSASFKVE